MTREERNQEMHEEIQEEEKKERRKKWTKRIIKGILFLTVFLTLFFTYTTYVSTVKIETREYRIISKKIPDNLNGLKIIQFSDLHYGSTMFQEELQKVIDLSNERNPDIIVFTGDLISKNYKVSSEEQEEIITLLKSMKSSLGKYAILGDEDNESISTIYNQSDFMVLRNEYDLIYKDTNNPILLVGISSITKSKEFEKGYQYFSLEGHNPDIYTITILHEPDTVDEILRSYSSDLFLAGHSHNGNIRVPFMKFSFIKKENARKYDQDYYKIGNSELYVSSGLGTESGFRLFCRPSINFFRLSNH